MQLGRQVLVLGVTYEKETNTKALAVYGYQYKNCQVIETNSSRYLYKGYVVYELCSVESLDRVVSN